MIKKIITIFLLLFSTIIASEASAKKIKGKYYLQLQTDKVNSIKGSNTNNKKITDTFFEAKTNINLELKNYLSLNSSWSLHTIKAPPIDKNRFFTDEAIILEELNLKFSNHDADLVIGKFNPNYAIVWSKDIQSGIWGNEYAEEYQLVGKLGAKINAKINLEDYGNHIVTVSSFFNDETGLEDTIITKSNNNRQNIGQSGNSMGLSSYSLNIYGDNFYQYEGLFYNISFQNIDPGSVQNSNDQSGYALTLGVDRYMLYNLKITPLIEYNKISNNNSVNYRFGPEFGDNELPGDYEYLTMILALAYQNWGLNINKLNKDITANSTSYKANQSEFSISYKFANNAVLAVGRKVSENQNKQQMVTFGAHLSLQRTF